MPAQIEQPEKRSFVDGPRNAEGSVSAGIDGVAHIDGAHTKYGQRNRHTKLTLGRKPRHMQTVIEWVIRSLAFVSFAAIILIFVFVFREAAPMFSSRQELNFAQTDTLASNSYTASTTDTTPASTTPTKSDANKRLAAATKIETATDASGNKIKVTKNDGKVAQEVYDPLADDEDEQPAKENAAPVKEKAAPAKEKPAAEKPAAEKPVAKKAATPEPAKAAAKTEAAAEVSKDSTAAKQDLTFTKTKGDGKIEQEVYDPFANEDGLATIKPKTSKAKKTDTSIFATQAAVDSAALAAEAAARMEADSDRVREAREKEELAHVTDLAHLASSVWQPVSTVPKFGLLPLFIGTLKVTLLAILFGAPIAILAALYTSTFAPKWAREFVKPAIELLAGFPSVVIGFFALIVMATVFQEFFHYQYRLNSLLGGVAMSFAVIPIIYTITEDALVSVPESLKQASDALGATKWQTAFRVVLPAAIPGVFAAVVLGFGRAFGETMIALMATGNAPLSSFNLIEPVRTLSATIGAEMAEVVFGDQHYNVLFFIGALLFIFTFTMNAVVEFWVRKSLMRRVQGKA